MTLRAKLLIGAVALVCVAALVASCVFVLGSWRSKVRAVADGSASAPADGANGRAPEADSAESGNDAKAASPATESKGLVDSEPQAGSAAGDGVTKGKPPMGAAAIDSSWLNRQAGVTGVPRRVLLAYVTGANWANKKWTGCNIDWSTLAGIGYVETHHGTINGADVEPDGVARPRIVGVALDGEKTAHIADTDGGKYDGDSDYDRAVGPMQFIPGSWVKHAVDANEDGKKNPQHVDDAAFSTARYMCGGGANLSSTAAWQKAILSYNDSWDYVNQVSKAAGTIAANSRAAAG